MSFKVAPEPTEAQEDRMFREYLGEIDKFLEWDRMCEEDDNKPDEQTTNL